MDMLIVPELGARRLLMQALSTGPADVIRLVSPDDPTRSHVGPRCHPGGAVGAGNPDGGVVLVGIAPGSTEIRQGTPFLGQSGKLLDSVLRYAGWDRSRTYATNLICYYDNAPSPEDIARCAARRDAEIAAAKPKLIVTLGAPVCEAMTGYKVGKARGAALWSKKFGCYIMPTWHPAYVLRGQFDAIGDIVRDFRKIGTIMGWPQADVLSEVKYYVMASVDQAQRMLDALPTDRIVSLDIETTNEAVDAIDAWKDKLYCLAISDGETTWVVPSAFCAELSWPQGVQWTYHGAVYDVPGLRTMLDLQLPIVHDTILLSYSFDERKGNHGLKPLAREFQAAGFYEDGIDRKHLERVEPAKVYEYNAKDAAYTARNFPILKAKAIEYGGWELYQNTLLPAQRAFADLRYQGIPIDGQAFNEVSIEWFEAWLEQEAVLKQMATDAGWSGEINLNSTQQIGKLLYGLLGLPAPPNWSTKRDILETLTENHPFVEKLLEYRRLSKLIDGYVLTIRGQTKYDGRVHPNVLLHGQVGGRPSFQEPAMQTLPKEYTVGANLARIRRIFVGDSPDHVILEADYQQIEVWVDAFLSGDPTLMADLLSGDVHSRTAEGAFHVLQNQFTPADWDIKRQNAKKIRFGLAYGEGAEKLAGPRPIGIGCSIPEAKLFIKQFYERYAVSRAWRNEVEATVKRTGQVRSASGRTRRFHLVMDHKQLRQAINFLIQSTASDFALTSFIELYWILQELGARILFIVHDSLVTSVPKARLEEVARLIKTTMEKPRIPGLPPVKVDLKVGPNLFDVQKFKLPELVAA